MKHEIKKIETKRLQLRTFSVDDAPFYMTLVNEPGWIRFIGQRNLRTIADTETAILKGPVAMYERHGFCLFVVERKSDGEPIGICGLIKRDQLQDVDLGFAFLEAFQGQGYALEAATATMQYAAQAVQLKRIVAITSLDNDASIKLLGKLGFIFERTMAYASSEIDTKLFVYQFAGSVYANTNIKAS